MAQNVFGLVHTLFSNSGVIEPGGTIEFFRAGTSTLITVYSDMALTTTAGTSVTADAAGRFPERWIASGEAFKLVYKNAAGTILATRDYANSNGSGGAAAGTLFFLVDGYEADPTGTDDSTAAIQACSAALEAAGGGTMWFTPGGTYKVYPDTSNTTALGDFDNCQGVNLATNGCTFTIARAFTGSQIVYPWIFNGCDGVTVGDHTVTCAQVDTPTDAWTRGIGWLSWGERNSQVSVGHVKMTGGRICVDVFRSTTTVTDRTLGVHIAGIECSGVGYPMSLRNSGDEVDVGYIRATDCTRPFIIYGFRNFSANVERISTGLSGEADCRIIANGTGSDLDLSDPVSEGLEVWYKSNTAPTNTAYFRIEIRGTSACTLRDIDLHTDIEMDIAGGSSQQIVQFNKRSDASTFDSTVRGHTLEDFRLRGNGRDVPANRIMDMFNTDFGDWSGETRRNIRIEDFHVQGSGSSTLVGDWRGITGLRLENFNFPGTQSWKGTMPNTGKCNRNLLYNGAMAVAQRGTSFTATSSANNDDSYTLDRWILLSDGNDTVDVTQSTSVVPTGGIYSMALDVETANRKFGIVQVIPNKDCIGLLGKKATFQFKARKGGSNATAETLRFGILAWSSTADSVTSDVVSGWSAAGTNPALASNWTYENTPVSVTLTNDWTTYAVSAEIDTGSTTNIAVFIWCDDTDATVADFIYITDCKLEAGPDITPFVANAYEEELRACRHFYQAVTVYVPATTAQNLRAINMRGTPTIAGGGGGFDSTGTTADSLIAFQTAGATAALTLSSEL